MRVGFIGLGSQGGPMARRIVEAGFETTLWARRPESLDPYRDTDAKFADSPAKLAAASEVVCLCVVADEDVRQVITGENGVLEGLREGGIIVVHSTIHPDTARDLAAVVRERGATLIDAPVSGGGMGAAAGTLLVMVGGDTETVERCRPVFETYGNPVVHLGDLGAGLITKLLNNLLFTANLALAENTLTLGAELGVDPERLGEVVSHGSANSFALGRVVSAGGSLDRIGGHAGDLLKKDVSLVAGIADAAGVAPGITFTAADATLEKMGRPR